MTASKPSLTRADVLSHVRSTIFTSSVEGRIGVEIEWFPVFEDDPGAYVPLERLKRILDCTRPLPCGSTLSFEPGGQLEISSIAGRSASATCTAAGKDLDFVRSILSSHGIKLVGVGLDPIRPGRRVLALPRYEAMEAYFDAGWPEGRSMMRATASVHVNLDVNGIEEGADRWRLVHAMGPTFCAAFANSAIARGSPTGWKSSRLALWQALDPSRTLPTSPVGDPVEAWATYALRARVMFIRHRGGAEAIQQRMTFAQWLEQGHGLGFPDLEDLTVHLSTLFPPIRPKGWLELRMIDALPDPWWRVPVVVASMVYDEEAARRIDRLVEPTADLWEVAARQGMENELLSHTAQGVFNTALDAIERLEVDDETAAVVEAYNRKFVQKGRSPADEQLEAWGRGSSLLELGSMECTWT
ncbi:MAG TPA: glutamate-cysteine ligase family protein [Actinomycetota bacterium]|nr:glutamate-cysteine ligase family protein [Actinomycetota bacterium]